jgi:hypothetical protein
MLFVLYYITEGKPRRKWYGNGKYLVGAGEKVCSYYRCLRISLAMI